MLSYTHSVRDDDVYISEELIGRLIGATEDSLLELAATFQTDQRASLAVQCYRKSHLRGTGLTVASTCDLASLVRVCGPICGEAIFAQSRRRSEEPRRLWGRVRPTITLARSAGVSYPTPVDQQIECEQDGVAPLMPTVEHVEYGDGIGARPPRVQGE
jgi:hypothetical protein